MSSSNDLQLGGSVRKMTGPVIGSKYDLKVLVNNFVAFLAKPLGSGGLSKIFLYKKRIFFFSKLISKEFNIWNLQGAQTTTRAL